MASNPRNENSSMSNKLPAVCNFESDKLVMKLKVTLAAERKSVDPVVRSVMDIVRNMQCATGKEDDIEVALTEALANAVVHGAKEDPKKIVECLVACDEDRAMLIMVRRSEERRVGKECRVQVGRDSVRRKVRRD